MGVSSGTLPVCTYRWYITGGTIQNNTNIGTTITVKWHDQTGQGNLTVIANSCSLTWKEQTGNQVVASYTRHSVFGKNFPSGACNNSIDVPLCSSAPVVICADKMYIDFTGSAGQPPLKEVDAYVWTIPSGWKQASSTNVGPITFTTTANSIILEPLSSNGGTVSVLGSIANTCGTTVSKSNAKTITITRSPTLSVNPAYTATCGLTAPVTFAVSTLPCATSYTWSIPSGWTGTSTTNSITLTPNGTSGGTVSLTIATNIGTSVNVSRNIPYANDAPGVVLLTKNNSYLEFCVGESFIYTATPPSPYPTNFGFDWYASDGLLINGSATSVGAPVHTTTNSITVSTTGQAYGTKSVSVRLNNTTCTPGRWNIQEIKVEVYSNSEFSIIGPSTVCPNTAVDFSSSIIGGSVIGYQWSAPSGWSNSGQGTPYFSISVPPDYSGGQAVTLRLQNRYGLTNTPYVLQLASGICGFSASPNPASNMLVVSDLNLEESETAEATLIGKNNKVVSQGTAKDNKIELDVSKVPNGQYVLVVNYKGKAETKNIVVNH